MMSTGRLDVRSKAARSDNHAVLRVKGVGLAVHRRFDAHDAAFGRLHEFFGLHARDDRNVALLCCSHELLNEFHAGRALRNEGAFARVTAEEEEVVFLEFNADHVAAPERGRKSVFDHRAHDRRIALVVAALHRIFEVPFHRIVENAELTLNPVVGGGHLGARNKGVAADSRHLFEHDDVGTRILRGDGSRETRAARTNYDNVVDARFGHLRCTLHEDA